MNVGFIGLGIMGSRMAANLLANQHSVSVHNRSADKAQSLLDKGAVWADSPAAAAEDAEVLITMLAHPDAVEAMALGDGGFLDHLTEGALWVDCSTVNPAFTRKMATEADKRGVRFVDAPVSGSKGAAANAELLFVVGGADEDVATAQPLFDVMGRKTMHVGAVGAGISLKVVMNYLLASSLASFGEAMRLGQALGIAQDRLFETLIGGPLVAPVVGFKQSMMEQGNYDTQFPLKWMHKDVQMATLTAADQNITIPLAEAMQEVYQQAIDAGFGEQDFSAIYAYFTQ